MTNQRVRTGLALFLASIAAPPCLAQVNTERAAAAQTLERVEVTGSAIKRTTSEGPSPVEVITRADIAKTGATTVSELLKSIPAVDIFNQGELAGNSPAGSGTTRIALRGLSDSDVLVLLNGRRLPVNALYDSSGAGAAVNVNMIPLSMIERIEILKDGGSAIYGADAISGVVNFITRRDYQGAEVRGGTGLTSRSDGFEWAAGLAAGTGDYERDGYNAFVGVEYFRRDPILRKDRDITRSVDFRRFGSLDRRSAFAPTGNIVDPNTGALVGMTYKDCPAESFNGVCRYDFNQSLLTGLNGADRLGVMGLAQLRVSPNTRAFVDFGLSRSRDHFELHPVPDYFAVPVLNAQQAEYQDPANPGVLYIAGRFMQGGPRTTQRTSDMVFVATGMEGTVGQADWKFAMGRAENRVENHDYNYFDAARWAEATSNGTIDPTIATNSTALVNSLKVSPIRTGRATVTYLNGQIGRPVFALPGGPAMLAVGAAVEREALRDTPDPLTQAGAVVGSIQQAAVDAGRTHQGVFAEFVLPLLRTLEGQAAIRWDRYPGISQASPKFALKWNVLDRMALRGSVSHSFRAPALKQLFGSRDEGAITITDPDLCAKLHVAGACIINAFQVGGANPNLKPERANTFNLGVVGDVGPVAFTADWWRIQKRDNISSITLSSAIDHGHVAQVGPRYYIYTTLQNIAQAMTEGYDVDARLNLPTPVGALTLRNTTTYYTRMRSRDASDAPWGDFLSTYASPRWRNVLALSLERGGWNANAALRSVAGFYEGDTATYASGSTRRRVGAYDELDFSVRYAGLRNLEVFAGVKNVFDRMPPFSVTNTSSNAYTQMGFAEMYDARGRFFHAGFIYKIR